MAINSSLSCIYEQIFRLLLKISVYERHQLRIQTIFIKLPTGKQYYLQLQNLLLHSTFIPAFQTIPNESFHQIIDINSSRAQKQKWETLLKMTWKPTAPSVPRRSPIQVLYGSPWIAKRVSLLRGEAPKERDSLGNSWRHSLCGSSPVEFWLVTF